MKLAYQGKEETGKRECLFHLYFLTIVTIANV